MPDEAKPQETPIAEKIVAADTAPPPTIPWYQSPQVIAAVAAVGGGVAAFCSAFHIVIPYSAIEITAGLGGLLAVLGGGFALYRRIKAGLDPHTDASKITFFK